ncbi:DUF4013 domain-containing protein [Natrononativus amylolyticus]|uniref:DUF4013 domain-containing protein n=1 Tax=Natrononativus amylolyticus TaxID=2963434 RepID=UPI0020CCFBC3|nr:DUF4013 domain-containing protein [Natrononativus amylolyticus]
MLAEAIGYLKSSDDVWKTSVIGGLLLAFGFLLIPLFVVWGYVVRVVDRTAHDDEEAPVFEDWGEMTVEGAKAFAILLVYALVPLVVGSVIVGGVWAATGGAPGAVGGAIMALGGLLTVALLIAAAYVGPAAIAHFAEERRFGDGFDFETLRPVLSSGTYATRWLLSLAVIVVAAAVSGALNAIPIVGIFLGAVVSFYALVTAYYIIGHAWADARPVSLEDRGDFPREKPAV